MNSLLQKNLISTKEASALSGYNADYLSRLCREKKIASSQVGRTWLIESASLVVFMENQIDRKIVLAENLARERELEYSKANSSGARLSRVAGGLENKARVVAGSMLGVLSTVRIPRSMPIVSGQAFAAGLTAVILGASVTLAGSGVVARAGEMILGSAFQVRVIAIEYMSSSNSFALARTAKLSRIAEEETGKINTTVLSAVDTRVVMLPVIMRGVIDEAHEPIQISELAYERAEEIFETYPEPLASGDVVGAVVYSVNSPQELFVAMARETMLAYSLVGAYVLNDIETVLALHMQGVEVVSDGLLSTSAIVRDVSRHAPLAIGNAFVNASTATMSSYERALYAYVENIEVVPSVLVGTVHELGSSIGGFVALGVQSAPVVYNESVTTFANESASVGSMISEDSFAFGKESNKTVSGLLEAQDRAIAQSVEEARFAFTGFENVVANTALVIESTPSFATDAILGIAGSIAFRIEAVDTGVLSASPLASLDVERFIPDFLREVTSILARVAGSAFHGIFGPLAGFFGAGEEIGLVVIPELLNEEVASVGVMSSGETIVYEGPVTNIHNEYISVSNIGGVSQVYVDTQLESLRYSLVRSMENINRRSSTQTTTGISSIDDMTGSGLTLNSSTFNGGTIDGSVLDVATSTITGQLTVDGTAQASIVQATNYIAGPYILATSTTATSAFSGNIAVGRNTTLGTTASDYLIVNSTISSSLVPSVTNTYDIGSASKIWRRGYFDELVVNTFTIASSSVSGTVSDTFTVNSDNATNDLEDMSIIFDRGSASPNALLAWNSTSKRFEFNMPVFSANATFTNATTTSFETTNFTLNSSLFTSLLGTGLSNVGGALTLNATGDWTGTFDGIEGSAYLARANHTGTQLAATISDFAATARGLFSSTATGLTYTSGTGAFSLTSGYNIPLTASTTEWNTTYTSRLSSATYPLQFASNVLSLAFGTTTANTWSALQTFGNTVSTNATTTSFGINAETFMDLTGTGLQNTGGVLTLNATGDWTGTLDGQEGSYYLANSFATTSANFWETQQTARSADDLTNNSIEDLSDVAAMSEAFGNLLSWNGSTWTNVATSTLGITGGGGGTWGSITGTLSSQTDLQSALDAKFSLSSWFATTTDALAEGSTNLYFTNARADARISAATTTIRSMFTAGSGLTYSAGQFALNATGDWTGTFDGIEGSAYLARANHTGTQLAATISDFAATARGLFSSSATGLTYTSGTGAFSLASGYEIPLSASTTEWSTAYLNRITSATSPLSITNNVLSLSTTGDWTGTLDGQEGSYYLANSFATTSANFWETQQTARSADDLTNNSIEDLSDVAAMSEAFGNLLSWNGSTWTNVATSTLGIAISDTIGTLAQTRGGTGLTSYTSGDILYADNGGNLTALPKGSNGQVLKLTGGLPAWGTDIASGGGGGASAWATTTDNLAIYPADTSDVLIIGGSATSTSNSILEVFGTSYFSNTLGVATTAPSSLFKFAVGGNALFSGNVSLANLVATGTATTSNLTITSVASALLKTNSLGQIISAVAGTDYENPLTFGYPLVRTTNAISLAFGTTTANTWSALQTFGNTVSTNATTTSFGINAETFTDLTGTGLQNVGGLLTLNATGDWTGTFDGQEGSAYLARANHTGTQLAATISDFAATARGLFSSSATGLTYTSGTGAFSLTSGYSIPLTASTTEWSTAYTSRLSSATYPLQFASNVLSLAFGTTTANSWSATQTFSVAPILTGLSGLLQGNGSSAVTAITGTAGQFPYYNGTNTLAATSSIFLATSGNVGIGTTTPLAKLQVGAYYANNSSDSQILISRQVDDSVAGNGHAFSDSSNVNRSGTIGYNSYDARITYSGSNNYDHYAAFQAAPVYGSSGTMSDLYGVFDGPTANSGTITNRYGVYVSDVAGAGTITNNYGLYAASLTRGTNNFGVYTAGATKSYFGGNVGIGTTSPYAKLSVVGEVVAQNFTATSTTATSTISGNLVVGLGSGNKFLMGTTTQFSNPTADVAFQHDWTNGGTAWYFTNKSGTQTVTTADGQYSTFYVNNFSGNAGLFLQKAGGGSGDYLVAETAAGLPILSVKSAGNVGIGTTTPFSRLSVAGNAYIGGNLTATGTATIGTLTGLIKGTAGILSAAVAGTDYVAGVTGDWTGTFDGQEGSYYLARANHTGTQLASTISDFSATARGLFSSTATGLTYTSGTGVFSLTSGYEIPLTASTTNWNTFYGTPSARITAGNGLSWSSNTLNVSTSSLSSGFFLQGGNSFGATAVLGTNDSNALTFEVGGTEYMRIGTSGSVGIGTQTPGVSLLGSLLDVQGSQNSALRYYLRNTNAGSLAYSTLNFGNDSVTNVGGIYVNSSANATYGGASSVNLVNITNSPLSLATNDTVRLMITGAGNVGIGSTTPWGQLSASSTSAYPALAIEQKSTGPAAVFLGGNVGIGTSSPFTTLSVTGNSYLAGTLTTTGTATIGTLTGLIKGTSGVLSAATAGTDYENPLTFGYPLVRTTNAISLAFGTTTANSWSSTQTFSVAPILTGLSGLLQGNGSSAVTAITGTAGQFPYYNGTNTLAATSTIFLATSGNVGIGTTTPSAQFAMQGAATAGAVTSFAVYGNTPTASGAGGGILLNGGAANAGFGNGGAVAINGGAGNTSSTGGAVTLTGGAGWTGGAVAISGGAGNSIVGGALTLSGGNGPSGIAGATASFGGGSSSGAVALTLTGAPSNVAGGAVTLTGGLGAQGGGSLNLLAGNSSSGSFSSGTVYIAGGTGGTAQGNVVLAMNNAGTAIGNVSIASTTPYARLSVWGAGATSATRAFEAVNSASTTLMVIRNDGNVGIGTTTPGSLLSVAGAAYVSGFINTSGITGGYKQDGSTILMASSTNFSTLVGDEAGRLLGATGFRSTAVGYNALYTATSSDNNTAVGYYALRVTTSGESNTVVGAQSLQANTTGSFNVALGDEVLLANTTGSFNTAIGSNAMRNANTGSRNFGLGYAALSANTGNDNMGIGYLALSTNTSGTDNTGIGYNAFGQTTTGSYNIGMGYTVGLFNKTGTSNVAIGTAALYSNTSATSTVSIGYLAAYGSASYNSQGSVAIGYQAGRSFATGSDYNTLVGYKSGDGLTTGARNVLLGNSTIAASYNQVTTGSNNIAIGNDVAVPTATASNQLVIGNLIYGTGLSGTGATVSTGNIGIGTTSPSQALSVQGNGLFSGNLSSANLTATGTATIGSLTGLIKGTSGVLSAATAGTDYENPLTFGYPLVRTTNAISLAFGTTTSNTWAGTQTFTNAPVLTSLATPAGTFLAVNAAGTIIATTTPAGGGSGTVGTGTTGQFPYYAAGGTTLTATSSIFLAASGNVGVGSTTPNTKFVVQGSSIGNVQLGQFASNANYGAISLNGRGLADAGFNFASSNLDAALAINRPTGAVISFRENNGTSQMVIAAGGNVGIGTISPSSLLHLAGSAGASLNTILEPTGWSGLKHRFGVQYSGDTSVLSNNALLTSATAGTLDNTAQTGSALILGSSGILNYVQASAGSGSRTFTSRLYVDSAGSVGIGTTSPSSLLHLEASSPVLTLKSNISSGLTGINFQNNTSGGAGTLSFNHNTGEIKFGNTAGTGYFTTFYSGNGTEKMRIDTAGNVGIGTTSPMSLLSVSGLSTLAKFKSTTNVTNAFTVENSTGTNVFQVDTLNNSDSIFSVASSTGSTYFYVGASGNIGIGTTTPGAALDIYNGALCVDDATPTCQNAARTAGTIYAVSTSLTGIDLAERYPTKDPTLAKGEIVMLDPENPVFVSRASDGAAFLGVVSTKPGIELGGFNDVLYKGEKHVPLALAGRVPILVNMEGGPIKPGDAITISSVPGVGKKATDSVQTIGVALEPASQNGSVQVFIKPEYTFIPKSVALASATSTVNAVSASTLAVSDAATFTGTLRADVVRASSVIVPRVTTSYVFESTSYTPIIPDEALTASGVNLYTLSTYTLAKAQDMTAKLVALNLSLDTLEARIAALESTASSTPALNESGFLSMFESAFGSLGASVSDGVASFLKLKVGDLVIGKQADNRSAAGAGSILAGNTVVEVTNSKALPSSRIIITSTSAVSGSWYISTKAVGSFRITLTNAQENDFTFDYLIIQTEGDDETPQATQSQDVSPEPTVPVTVTAPNTSTSVTGDETSVPAPDPIIPDPLPTQPAPAPIVAPEPPPAPVVSPEPVPAPVPSETPSESSTPAP